MPRKNVKLLGGRPLLAYTAEAAFAARSLARVLLTTDDDELAEVGASVGLWVPFRRPPELANDTAPMLPVIQHALESADALDGPFDAICLLQPTNPFRTASDIDACVALLESSSADSVISVLPVPPEHNPHWVYFQSADGALRLCTGEAQPISRRQELPPAYHREGSVYVSRHAWVRAGNIYGERTVGFEMDPARSVNIDTPEDWAEAEAKLASMRPRR